MGLPERPAMRVKGLRVVDWRNSSGRGLVETKRGRRDVEMSEESIVNRSSSS